MAEIFDDPAALHNTVIAQAAPILVVDPAAPAQPPAEMGEARRAAAAPPAPRATPGSQPLPRSQISAPICLAPTVSDTAIYEDPGDPKKTYYLPRYRAAQETVNGRQQFRVSLHKAASSQNWQLSVSLQAYPAPEIGDRARSAAVLPHDVQIMLRYTPRGESAPTDLTFQEVRPNESGYDAILTMSDLSQQHAVYLELTTGPATGLVVRRSTTAAIPLGQPAETLYTQSAYQLDVSADPSPFVFPPSMYGYVTDGVQPPPEGGSRLRLCEARWRIQGQDRGYVYYQNTEQGRRNEFFYLPDTFKISRVQSAPHVPAMSVKYEIPEGGSEVASAILQYRLAPYTDPRRLSAAAIDLRKYLDGSSAESIELKPLTSAAKRQLFMRFPGQGEPVQRKEATIDLQYGIQDEVRLTMAQFTELYAALYDTSDKSLLFNGRVEVTPPGFSADPPQQIHLVARLADTVGSICDVTTDPDGSGALLGRLQNRIESPVQIKQVTATVWRQWKEDKSGPGEIRQFTPSLPVTLNPDDEATFVIVPPATLPPKGTLQALVDLPGLKVDLNKEAVYDSILDGNSPESYTWEIRVQTRLSVFDARPSLAAIVVDFEMGESVQQPGESSWQKGASSVQLTPDGLEGRVKVRMPVRSFVLQLEDPGTYSYSVTTVGKDLSMSTGELRTARTNILYITVK